MTNYDNANPAEAIHNEFTGYLLKAIKRKRKDYIARKAKFNPEIFLEDAILESHGDIQTSCDFEKGIPLEQQLGNEHLLTALRQLQLRERYILLARVLENRPFDALAAELGLSYKGVTAIYYRTLKKIKQTVEEENNEL